MSVLDQLEPAVRADLVRVLAQGSYSVLLGAGSSADSLSPDGSHLPLADDLSARLSRTFGVPADPALPATYERACRNGRTDAVYRFLHETLSGCQPADWYQSFVALPWRRLWTLNIDDVVETAYRVHRRSAFLTPKTIRWYEPYSDELHAQLIHLHGFVGQADPTPLVFSILEYINVRDRRTSWHPIFADQWSTTPFVVIGASLTQEYDLATVFRQRRPPDTVPSIYVSRTVNEVARYDLESWGLHPVEATAENFFRDLHQEVSPLLRRTDRPWARAGTHRASAIFSQQFRHLSSDAPGVDEAAHDLYKGDQPSWSDVVSNLDAETGWSVEGAKRVLDDVKGPVRQHVITAVGPRLSGKSTGLLRIGSYLDAARVVPLLFRAEQGLNVDATRSILQENTDFVLLFDGIADHVSELRRLLEQCASEKTPCRVVAVERDVRLPVVLGTLTAPFFDEGSLIEIAKVERAGAAYRSSRRFKRMERTDAESLTRKLSERGRLGTIDRLPWATQVRTFVDNGLFAGLEIVSLGPQFRDRIRRQIDELRDPSVLRALLLVSMIDTLGYSTPIEFLGVCAPAERDEVDVGSPGFRELIVVRESRMFARHRSLGLDAALGAARSDDILDLLVSLLKYMRPYVTHESLRQGSLHALIARGLLRARMLQHWVGLNRLEEFYESLSDEYSWNSRYWEQRAIAAELRSQWESASSFAARACGMTPDDHRLTTYGSVLINRALQTTRVDEVAFLELYRLGRKQFNDAHRYRPANPVPIEVFVTLLVRVALSARETGARIPSEVIRDWATWEGHARGLSSFSFGPLAEEFALNKATWMKAALFAVVPEF